MLDQRVEHVADAGHRWLDYHLTVAEPGSGHPVRMLFRVDAVTKLPSLSRIERQHEGKPSTVETQFDYPDAGPADLYALGVPRAAKRVDRVLVGDLKRIVETIRAGRVRMDNYRAVFVQDFEGHDDAWWTDTPTIFYRKGKNLRGRITHPACRPTSRQPSGLTRTRIVGTGGASGQSYFSTTRCTLCGTRQPSCAM